jgi:dCMP deaminase
MKPRLLQAYMRTAETFAELSHARRLHVGAIVVKDDRIISIGYNGMPAGWDNNCEYKEYFYYGHSFGDSAADYFDQTDEDGKRYRLKTRPEVLHAERNALDKLAKGNEGGAGATMFITHAPCLECSKSIYGAGIAEVFYKEDYKSDDGIQFLKKCGVKISKLDVGDK